MGGFSISTGERQISSINSMPKHIQETGTARSVCALSIACPWSTHSLSNQKVWLEQRCPKRYATRKATIGQPSKQKDKRFQSICDTVWRLPACRTSARTAIIPARLERIMAKSKFKWWQMARIFIQAGQDHEWLIKTSTLVATGNGRWERELCEQHEKFNIKHKRFDTTSDALARLKRPCCSAKASCCATARMLQCWWKGPSGLAANGKSNLDLSSQDRRISKKTTPQKTNMPIENQPFEDVL